MEYRTTIKERKVNLFSLIKNFDPVCIHCGVRAKKRFKIGKFTFYFGLCDTGKPKKGEYKYGRFGCRRPYFAITMNKILK
jgi:hypothetical protein